MEESKNPLRVKRLAVGREFDLLGRMRHLQSTSSLQQCHSPNYPRRFKTPVRLFAAGMLSGDYHGGWKSSLRRGEYPSGWNKKAALANPGDRIQTRPMGPAEIEILLPDERDRMDKLIEMPFFQDFQWRKKQFADGEEYVGDDLCVPMGQYTKTNLMGGDERFFTRVKLLAEAIPALSNAVGRNAIGVEVTGGLVFENYDMQNRDDRLPIFITEWPVGKKKDHKWLHSDVKNLSYVYVSRLFDEFVNLTH